MRSTWCGTVGQKPALCGSRGRLRLELVSEVGEMHGSYDYHQKWNVMTIPQACC